MLKFIKNCQFAKIRMQGKECYLVILSKELSNL